MNLHKGNEIGTILNSETKNEKMARMPLTGKNMLRVMRQAASGKEAIFYPITLQITLDGNQDEIRTLLEKLAAKGMVERHRSKIPLVPTLFGYGYYMPKD